MAWLRRRKGSRPSRRLPRRQLAPVEDIVEQGLLVADVAARMTVKNAIIMNALKRKVDYDKGQIVGMVRDAVVELADERERDARYIGRIISEIHRTGRSAWKESEYGNDDNRTLRHRQEVYEGVAEELHRRVDDEEYLTRTAERARAAAWDEIGNSLAERATHPYYAGGNHPEYRRERDSRIQLLIERDLTELVQQRAAGAGSEVSSEAGGGTGNEPGEGRAKRRIGRRKTRKES